MGEGQEQQRGMANHAKTAVFVAAGLACVLPWGAPWIALSVGIVLALVGLTAFEKEGKKLSRVLIQVCVVLLGLRIDLNTLYREATNGLVFAAGTIIGTLALGLALGRALKNERATSLLVSSGTAICGGSAIAAVGSAIRATSTQMAVATGAVFLLNAAALFLFPVIGHALHLSDTQFGTWAGVAIHDVSSVVGAAAKYHADGGAASTALDTANVVKLSRVIWIMPVAFFAAWWMARGTTGEKQKIQVPWFVLLFVGASAVRTFVPVIGEHATTIATVARIGFQGALFLIGAGLSKKAIASVGWRTLVQAVVVWIAIAAVSLWVVVRTVE